ncbi:MAG: response regulator transcription factor [Ruminococcus sp.]|nr:response regulator transcription factor [Ruminococcus sp.]
MNILYAEDEKSLSMAITEILKMEGFTVDPVYDGAEALEHLQTREYDAAVLDIMMPKKDGVTVLQQMRDAGDFTPVMLLTAKTQVEDRINGLTCGADDYFGKPFAAAELVARLQAMIRRSTRYRVQIQSMGNITLDCESLELKSDVGSLRLSSKESQLLSLFLKNKMGTLSAAQIQEKLWPNVNDKGVVPLYVSYLQTKLRQIQSSVNIEQSGDTYHIAEV